MQELEVTWSRALSVFWLLLWRGVLGAAIAGGVIGFILGFAFAMLRIPMEPAIPGIAGAIAGLAWYVVVVRMALRKNYRGFRIALLSHG